MSTETTHYEVGPERKPPPHPFYGDSWERGVDPWHADAFAGLEDKLGGNPGFRGERRGGWFLLDGHGTEIGWVPDGTKYATAPASPNSVVEETAP